MKAFTWLLSYLLSCLLFAYVSRLNAQQTPVAEAVTTDTEGFLVMEDGTHLAYRVTGTGSDTLIVPGGYSSLATDFSPLGKERRLILYDQRNRGHSDSVRDLSHVGMDYEVRDLEEVRHHFHAERVSLLGCSYLGDVVALYTLEHAEHVERLIQVDPIPPRRELFTQAEQVLTSRLDNAAVNRLERMREAGLNKVDPVQFCREAGAVYNPAYFGDLASATNYHPHCELENEQPDNLYKDWNAIDRSLGDWDWRPRLSRLKSPMLVIYGTKDWIPESAAREWVQGLPNARLLTLADVGHISWAERPDLVFSAVDSFLHGLWPLMEQPR
jgi:proline iminopeptidase